MYGAPNGQAFAQWLRSLDFIRNVCTMIVCGTSMFWNFRRCLRDGLLASTTPDHFLLLLDAAIVVNNLRPKSSWGLRFKNLLADGFPAVVNQQISLAELGVFSSLGGMEITGHRNENRRVHIAGAPVIIDSNSSFFDWGQSSKNSLATFR